MHTFQRPTAVLSKSVSSRN